MFDFPTVRPCFSSLPTVFFYGQGVPHHLTFVTVPAHVVRRRAGVRQDGGRNLLRRLFERRTAEDGAPRGVLVALLLSRAWCIGGLRWKAKANYLRRLAFARDPEPSCKGRGIEVQLTRASWPIYRRLRHQFAGTLGVARLLGGRGCGVVAC